MKEIKKTDIRDKKEFNRAGYHYTQVRADDEKHIYLYEMVPIDFDTPHKHYEVVKGIKRKNPDGSIVWMYPSDEMFGVYGYYICGPEDYCRKKIAARWEQFEKNPN